MNDCTTSPNNSIAPSTSKLMKEATQINDNTFKLLQEDEKFFEHLTIPRLTQLNSIPENPSTDGHRNRIPNMETPQPLPNSRPSVLPLRPEMLPDSIRDYIYDIADRQQSPPDFVAVAAIVGLSCLLGKKALILPKQYDDWKVTPNLWGALIGRPSSMKSPSMKEALKYLQQLDRQAATQFEEDKKIYEEECLFKKLEKQNSETRAKKALKADNHQEARDILRLSK